MNITQSILVCRKNIDKLRELDCLQFVHVDENDKTNITVRFKNSATHGMQLAHTGDHLVQYKTGMWQRIGKTAHDTLCLKPGK